MPKVCNVPSLSLGVFRFVLAPQERLALPALNKSNTLRGGFGHAFRRLCCIPQCNDAQNCPIAVTCPYKAIFEPSPPTNSDRLSKNQDIPRPFVFRAPQSGKTHFERGDFFEFDLVLLGRALEFVAYFVLAFRELASNGFGLNRARCTLRQAHSLNWSSAGKLGWHVSQKIFDAEDQLFRSAASPDIARWVQLRCDEWLRAPSLSTVPATGSPRDLVIAESQALRAPAKTPLLGVARSAREPSTFEGGGANASWHPRQATSPMHGQRSPGELGLRFTVRFLTPTLLKADGQVIRRPEFHHFFKRVRDRINALCTFFVEGPLQADFRGLGERAETVETVSSRFEWVERHRTSSKTGQRHELSGFVGEATYEGNFSEFLPWLALGELTHVGKHAAWGNGWFETSRLRPP